MSLLGLLLPSLKSGAGPAQPMNQTVDAGGAFPSALRNVVGTSQQAAQRMYPEFSPEDALAMYQRTQGQVQVPTAAQASATAPPASDASALQRALGIDRLNAALGGGNR